MKNLFYFLKISKTILQIKNYQFKITTIYLIAISIIFIPTFLASQPCNTTLVIKDGWNPDSLVSSLDFSPLITGNVLSTATPIKIEGEFIIDRHFNFQDVDFVMLDTNASIYVINTSTLIINGCTFKVCEDTMWAGITVVDTTSEVIIRGSEIWHAKKGVHSINGGKFTIDSTLFDANYYGIYIDEFHGLHKGKVNESTFRSSESLLFPYHNIRLAKAGIYLNVVIDTATSDGPTIGSPGKHNYFIGPNLFNFGGWEETPGLEVGVYIHKSSVNLIANKFLSFLSVDEVDPSFKSGVYGVGVYDPENFPIPPYSLIPTVNMGIEINGSNSFYNSNRGVKLIDIFNINIYN